jgi:hypothetical protein
MLPFKRTKMNWMSNEEMGGKLRSHLAKCLTGRRRKYIWGKPFTFTNIESLR